MAFKLNMRRKCRLNTVFKIRTGKCPYRYTGMKLLRGMPRTSMSNTFYNIHYKHSLQHSLASSFVATDLFVVSYQLAYLA